MALGDSVNQQVINDCNVEGCWVAQCNGMCLEGGLGGDKTSSLEAVMRTLTTLLTLQDMGGKRKKVTTYRDCRECW